MTKKQKFVLICIIGFAIIFRFYKLAEITLIGEFPNWSLQASANYPGGLFPDEAANGLDIILMEQGQIQPFYERGNGREALFFFLLWGMVKIFGFGVWQHHAVSAGVGVLAVIGAFLASRELFRLLNRRFIQNAEKSLNPNTLALLTAGLMAINTWHTVLSRTAFRANLIPVFTAFSVYFALKIYTAQTPRQKINYSTLFGIVTALGFYSYIAYRIFIPIMGVALLWPLIAHWLKNKNLNIIKSLGWRTFIPAILAFTLTIAPLFYYFYTHPGSFIGRSGQVSIFNPELNQNNLLGTLWEVSKKSFLAYFTQGDLNWRHNISGQPFLPKLISPFFLLGLGWILWKAIIYLFKPSRYSGHWPYFLLTGWFIGMLFPVITTAEGIPHGLRSIGTIPAVFIISAIGINLFYEGLNIIWKERQKGLNTTNSTLWYKAQPVHFRLVNIGGKIAMVLFFSVLVIDSYVQYFVLAYREPSNFYAFRSDLTIVSDYLKVNGDKSKTYLILDKFSVQTPDYLTVTDPVRLDSNPSNRPYIQVDPEEAYLLKEKFKILPESQVVFTQSTIFDIQAFKKTHPEFQLILERRNKFGQAVLAVYKN